MVAETWAQGLSGFAFFAPSGASELFIANLTLSFRGVGDSTPFESDLGKPKT